MRNCNLTKETFSFPKSTELLCSSSHSRVPCSKNVSSLLGTKGAYTPQWHGYCDVDGDLLEALSALMHLTTVGSGLKSLSAAKFSRLWKKRKLRMKGGKTGIFLPYWNNVLAVTFLHSVIYPDNRICFCFFT